jgi:hypothetical protein
MHFAHWCALHAELERFRIGLDISPRATLSNKSFVPLNIFKVADKVITHAFCLILTAISSISANCHPGQFERCTQHDDPHRTAALAHAPGQPCHCQ